MTPIVELYAIFIDWLKRKLRAPFSNFATKLVLFVGAGILATPLIEHLIFNAVLKKMFGIDLGITVPDDNAYWFGTFLIVTALLHNLIFIKLAQQHEVTVRGQKSSIYKEFWAKMDDMVDNTSRLVRLYLTEYDPAIDDMYIDQTEAAILALTDFVRKNRPFFFSEDLYKKAMKVAHLCMAEAKGYRGCVVHKKRADASTVYNFSDAQKYAANQASEIAIGYNDIQESVRTYIDSL